MFKKKQFPENRQQLEKIISEWPTEASMYDSYFEKYLQTDESGLYYAFSAANNAWILWLHKSMDTDKHSLSEILIIINK